MPVRYSTNWMGPVNTKWYKDRGLTKRVSRTLTEDNPLTAEKLDIHLSMMRLSHSMLVVVLIVVVKI